MVADVHPIFSHPLERLFIHQVGKGDRVLLRTSHHRHLEKSGVEIAHMCDGGVPLVEGSPPVDNRLRDIWTKDQCVHGWMVPFHRLNIRAQHQPVDHPCPTRVDHSVSYQKGLVDSRLQRSLPQDLVGVGRSFGWSLVLQCCRCLIESTLVGAS